MKEIAKGAEAKIYSLKIFNKNIIIKKRISKSYRNNKLDLKIINIRNKQESTLINKIKKININTPIIYYVGKNTIYLEKLNNTNEHKLYLEDIGKTIAKIHNNNIIHGDLNLINIITKNKKIYLIDFGLGFISNKIEDKATDLLVFKKTLKSNSKTNDYWKKIIKGYNKHIISKEIINKIKDIENRGRYL
jgi:bifunctional N6-L-threonylcarbamoyladenine synthase / protein kinase Bud32